MISVVIPLYNKAHTIERTLGSVLNQTFTNFEVVIVNDGSTDNGVEVIKNFTSDPRIRIINQENQGVSVARNRGVAESKFEYIAFLDGDDEWISLYLKKMSEAIRMFPNSNMFCGAGFGVNMNGDFEGIRLASRYINKIVEVDFFENPHVYLHTSATIITKTIFFKTNGFPIGMKRNEDFAFFFSIALIAKVTYIGTPLSIYFGGIENQATNAEWTGMLKHVINRYNYVHKNWIKQGRINISYIIFVKYELRHLFKSLMISKNYESLKILIISLDKDLLNFFSLIELKIYQWEISRFFAVFLINITKLRWRLRGYPYVGQNKF